MDKPKTRIKSLLKKKLVSKVKTGILFFCHQNRYTIDCFCFNAALPLTCGLRI